MNTSAVTTVKRRSMLPAPKSFSAGASVGASKSNEVLARKNKETTSTSTSDVQLASLKVGIASTVVGDGNESKGKLGGIMLDECRTGTESRQTQLRKPSNLQQPAVAYKRPSSASSVLSRAGQDLNHGSSFGKTSRDSGNLVKPTAVKRSATNVDDQNAEKKHNRVFRGSTSVSASHCSSIGTKQKRLPRLVDTTRKLKVPTNYIADDAVVVQSSMPETISETYSSHSLSETMSNAEPIVPTMLTSKSELREDATAYILPEGASSSCVECISGTAVGQEFAGLERSSGTVTVADVPDVLSQVTTDDSEHLASSSGSLGILDDADLLDTSLLSFNCSSAASTACVGEVAGSCNHPPDENTLPGMELCFKQSPSTSEVDPPERLTTSETSMPSPRPLSLMSNSSADVGIVADCMGLVSESCCQQERPSSYMSTSSADTGYQAEDAEMVTVSSPATGADADADPVYSAGLDVTAATLLAAGSASDSDITAGAVTNVQHADPCDATVSAILNNSLQGLESSTVDLQQQATDALDIVNHNVAGATESWDDFWQQMKTMQEVEEDLVSSGLLGSGDSSTVQQTFVLESPQQNSEQAESITSLLLEPNHAERTQNINSHASASSCADEITRLTADVGEMAAKSPKCAASSAEVARDKHVVKRLFSDAKHQVPDADSKAVAKLQKNVASRTPKTTEHNTPGMKVGSSSNVTPRQSSLTSQRSFDRTSSRSFAPLSGRVSSRPVDSTTRRPSVPQRTVKQPAMTGSGKQQTETRRKSSSASTSSRALLPDQKTTSDSSLAAGDFGNHLLAGTSVRSSTPVTSSAGDSNDTSCSISRVSSVSDASSPSASRASSGAFSAPVQQSTATVGSKSSASTPMKNVARLNRGVTSSTTKSAGTPSRRGTVTSETTAVKKVLTAKRGSVADAQKIGPQTESRRASVAMVTTNRSTTATTSTRGSLSRTNTLPSRPASAPKTSAKDTPKSSKSAVPSSRSATSSHLMKQSPQPDVVSNSIADERTSCEIGRLEAVCESTSKHLSAVSAALCERTKWFEAMTIVVQYLVKQEMGNEKHFTDQLNQLTKQLDAASIQLEEYVKQRDALISEIQLQKQTTEEQREQLTATRQSELQQLEMELNERNEDALHRLSKQHSEHITLLEASYHRQMSDMQQNFDEQLSGKESETHSRLDSMRQKHECELAELQSRHEQQLAEITERFELIKVSLSEKVEFLRTEGEELRRREKTYMEACQHDSEMRIQSALAAYAQEIDSLKAVLELRNGELHDVRQRNLECKRELEELPTARETIKRLQQKVENLEAIVDIRSDYEKQLTEKFQQLLRKYERESKANKRLSMDKEELMWRLSQGDPMPDTPRRSLSRSPTGDRTSKAPSPTSSSSLRPTSAVVLRPKKSTLPVQRSGNQSVNLRRSGTYDLLNQDIDENSDSMFEQPAE